MEQIRYLQLTPSSKTEPPEQRKAFVKHVNLYHMLSTITAMNVYWIFNDINSYHEQWDEPLQYHSIADVETALNELIAAGYVITVE